MDKPPGKLYAIRKRKKESPHTGSKKKGTDMEAVKTKYGEPIERYRISDEQKAAWRSVMGCLTRKIPHGSDGETLSEYISRKRHEEEDR